ncbi:hypothetical protein [Mucilaginibacter myungsuensis]|uniref:Cytochrome B n=1 Tax=Mucilaginibacter myungsuensis TaxID=649104 RepID=A0A929L066_9SPHI|nr:hypothetical protein [Mucilaginibacter myungsuensis]MBE9662084.1 hypothetical protein [Mucilaginibacter myungsuensis]MDN3599482.1 hypothetical protein [Mucilaginibacter myungsuensis]
MYFTLLLLHSVFRWVVLTALLLAIYRSVSGYAARRPFTKFDNSLRHWTATIAQLQMTVGMILYFKSPFVQGDIPGMHSPMATEQMFFKYIHIALMLLAVVLISSGSSMAKRKTADRDKFETMMIWFITALVLIFLAIPWPFSPLAGRPYL